MGISFDQPLFWLLLPPVLLAAWLLRRPWLELARKAGEASLKRERRRLWTRLLVLTLLVAALAGPRLSGMVRHQAVAFVLDASDSVGPSLALSEDWVRRALENKPSTDLSGTVAFGVKALVEEPSVTEPLFNRVQTNPGSGASNFGAALRLAGSLLPGDACRRVILLSDGRDTSGESLAAVRQLQQEGIRVDVVPMGTASGPDIRLESAEVPAGAFAGESSVLQVVVTSDCKATARVIIERDGGLLGWRQVELEAGMNRLSFPVEVGNAGLHRYQVSVQAESSVDATSVNNAGGAVQRVEGPPQVLLVTNHSQAAPLIQALQASGQGQIEIEVTDPGSVPVDPAGWAAYKAVFLVDVAAFELGARAMEQLESYVRDTGGGLVMTGGPDAYGPGGYADTPLERALPVEMNLPGSGEQPSLGLMLVIDKSGSMEGYKMELAKEAAARAAGILTPRDRVGVIAFDTAPWTCVSLAPVEDKEALEGNIGSIYAGGGTEVYPAVAAAYQMLEGAPVQIKHIILLTDGVSASGGPYEDLAGEMRRAGITLTTVAVGPDADTAMLSALAELGRGRFYSTSDAGNIPSIFTRETVMATRSFAVNERFFPAAVGGGSLLRGLSEAPALDGYVATTPKSRAEISLVSPRGDPILAAWQYGLGRAVAWTPDVAGRWSAGWIEGGVFPRLWGNTLSWVLGAADTGPMQAEGHLVESGNGRSGRIQVDDPGGWGEVKSLQASVVGPDGAAQSVSLNPAGPGRYAAEVPVPETGAYLFYLSDGAGVVARTGLVVPYPPEYSQTGVDLSSLGEIARAGGGEVLEEPEAAFARNLPPVRTGRSFSSWLLVLAALVWLADVTQRRLVLGLEERAQLRRVWKTAVKGLWSGIGRFLPVASDGAGAARSLETTRRLQPRRLGRKQSGAPGAGAGIKESRPGVPPLTASPGPDAGLRAGEEQEGLPYAVSETVPSKSNQADPQDSIAQLLAAKKHRRGRAGEKPGRKGT